jgi:hypothetical protein
MTYRLNRTAVAMIVGCAAVIWPAAVGAQRTPSCDRREGSTLLANKEVRVFQRTRRIQGVLASVSTYACNRLTGRLRSFGDGESGKDSGSTRRPTVAGRYVAYISTPGGPTGPIVIWNSRSGATRVQGTLRESDRRRADGSEPPVTGLVLTANGHVAWIVGPIDERGTYVVHADVPTSPEGAPILASGGDVAPDSLAAAGGAVYWTQRSTAGSAPLP